MTKPPAEVLGWILYLAYCDKPVSYNILGSKEVTESIFKCHLVLRFCAVLGVREECRATRLASVKC